MYKAGNTSSLVRVCGLKQNMFCFLAIFSECSVQQPCPPAVFVLDFTFPYFCISKGNKGFEIFC